MVLGINFQPLNPDPTFVGRVREIVDGVISDEANFATDRTPYDNSTTIFSTYACGGSHQLSCSRCASSDVITKRFATAASGSARVIHTANDHTLDLTQVDNIMLASPHQLREMESQVRETLVPQITEQHLRTIDATRLAAINPLDKVVPFRGDDGPVEVCEYPYWIVGAQQVTKMKPHAQDRFYLHFRGRGFTGVVRGIELSKEIAAPTVAHAGGQTMHSRADAEFAWLTGYYAGVCGRVVDAVLYPEVPEYA